ncbi:NAD-dependent succinate-semialdehyde dehydrogenase [Shewanella avicenniae]|uniref:NAD-dependent succinate-semialdehyde dehydrogenase n=1 Tax=Shewanella avicenniae TaxID=2814294 RepID=A0ABX7QUH9_9GAMM|nr:NAD-dependent succinate-semialdehyde dehydrogenase [Shewanella avicenniae]QSX34575.1 NAD-dependent succinate-semialdehyde dehydrogenase [Shewanella avicenniae]
MQLANPELLQTQAYIDGQWCDAANGEQIDVINPATEQRLASVAFVGASETQQAIAAAERALPAWRNQTAKARAQLLRRWYELIIENSADLALLMTSEGGKPLAEAQGEVAYAASFIEWFAEEAKRLYGDVIPGHQADKRLLVIRQGIGVCAAITPWNFPAAMITRKAGPALAAGCTMVLKPAEQTPLTALALAKLAEQAGIPAGVFNVLPGHAIEIGRTLTDSPVVRKLSFTGSTAVGIKLMQQSAATLKKLSLELGGNAPFIVFEDADIDAAVAGALQSKYRNAGQTCVCSNRFYIHDSVYDEFAAKLASKVAELKVGNGTDASVNIGPLIDYKALDKVQMQLQDAVSKGAKLLLGGERLAGRFMQPAVLTEVTAAMMIAKEETFGPVAPLFRFQDEQQVIELANDTEFGLASYFYSRDLSRVWRVAEALDYGMVGINTGLISNEVAPFGGVKASGLGREGSKYGIEDYLEMKYLCISI